MAPFKEAPRRGFEPRTLILQLPSCYQEAWTILYPDMTSGPRYIVSTHLVRLASDI